MLICIEVATVDFGRCIICVGHLMHLLTVLIFTGQIIPFTICTLYHQAFQMTLAERNYYSLPADSKTRKYALNKIINQTLIMGPGREELAPHFIALVHRGGDGLWLMCPLPTGASHNGPWYRSSSPICHRSPWCSLSQKRHCKIYCQPALEGGSCSGGGGGGWGQSREKSCFFIAKELQATRRQQRL
jgi:hypothetical protein